MVQKNTYRHHTFFIAMIMALVLIVSFVFSLDSFRPKATAAPNTYLNFQARLKNASGSVVPDGNYNVEFKLYDAASGGSSLWTETRTSGNRVRVANGYMTVSLGSVNAFPGDIAWGEEHWITMNIGGTGSPSWDGEMNPRLRLTAVPHAFQADRATVANALTDGVNTYTADNFLKVNPGTVQSTSSSSAAVSLNQTGSGSIMQLQSSGSDVLQVTNSGQALFKNATDSNTAFRVQNNSGDDLLSIDTDGMNVRIGGSSDDTTLLIIDSKTTSGDPTGSNGAMYYNADAGKFRCYEGGAWKDCIGGVSGGDITQGGNSFGSTMTIGTTDEEDLVLKSDDTARLTLSSEGGAIFDANIVLNGQNGGWGMFLNTGYAGTGGLYINGVASQTASLLEVARSDYAYNLFSVDSMGRTIIRGTQDSTEALVVLNAAGNAEILRVDTEGGTVLGHNFSAMYGVSLNTGLTITGSGSPLTFVTPQGSNVNTRINIPLSDPGMFSQLMAMGLPYGANSTARAISLFDNRAAGNNQPVLAVFNPDETAVFGLSTDGSANYGYLKGVGMGVGFKVGSTVGGVFNANGDLILGTSDANGQMLVLDNKTTSGDPTGSNGAMYYNADAGKFRCYEGGAWKDCIGGVQPGAIVDGGNSLGSNMTIGTNDNHSVSIETNGQTQLTVSSGGSTTFRNSVDSDNAFRIQSTGGLDVLNVSTINNTVSINGAVSGYSTWTSRSASQANPWRAVAYGNGTFVALTYSGTNRVMTSPDGVTWTNRSASAANDWSSITYGEGLFVAVASGGTNRVMTSPDGISWTTRTDAGGDWFSVTYGGGTFVATAYAGTNRVMTSSDGITWTARTATASNQWFSVTYGNGLFVAVSYDGTNRVMTSPDGVTWTARTAAAANSWRAVTYGNGLFVAVSQGGTDRVMTSPDGINWTARTASEANSWHSITYGKGIFVATSTSGTNRVMTSINGITWTAAAAPEANSWESIAFGNGTFVAVSTSGTNRVMTSSAVSYSDALNVNGNVTMSGNVTYEAGVADTATSVCRNSSGQLAGCTSASRFKDNVANLELGLDQLKLLQPVSYTWKSTGQNDIGFLAEQVAAVIPQAVTYDSNGEVASFNYNTISALLVSGVKDLDLKVTSIEARLATVEQGNFSGDVSIAGGLRVTGLTQLVNIKIDGKIISGGDAPTATTEDITGSVVISGNDTAGTISFTAGSTPASGKQVTVLFNSPYEVEPRVTMTAVTDVAASAKAYVEKTANGFTLHFTYTPTANSVYSFDYHIIQ